jgi:hypothetical protein
MRSVNSYAHSRTDRRLTVPGLTVKAWLDGRRSPSKRNVDRIERAYRTVRRENVARYLTARLNREGCGSRVEIHPLNQSQVSRPPLGRRGVPNSERAPLGSHCRRGPWAVGRGQRAGDGRRLDRPGRGPRLPVGPVRVRHQRRLRRLTATLCRSESSSPTAPSEPVEVEDRDVSGRWRRDKYSVEVADCCEPLACISEVDPVRGQSRLVIEDGGEGFGRERPRIDGIGWQSFLRYLSCVNRFAAWALCRDQRGGDCLFCFCAAVAVPLLLCAVELSTDDRPPSCRSQVGGCTSLAETWRGRAK